MLFKERSIGYFEIWLKSEEVLRKNTIFIKENESTRSKKPKFSPAARYIKESLVKSTDNHLSNSEFS